MNQLLYLLLFALLIHEHEGFKRYREHSTRKGLRNSNRKFHHKKFVITKNAAKRELVPNYLRGDNNEYMDGSYTRDTITAAQENAEVIVREREIRSTGKKRQSILHSHGPKFDNKNIDELNDSSFENGLEDNIHIKFNESLSQIYNPPKPSPPIPNAAQDVSISNLNLNEDLENLSRQFGFDTDKIAKEELSSFNLNSDLKKIYGLYGLTSANKQQGSNPAKIPQNSTMSPQTEYPDIKYPVSAQKESGHSPALANTPEVPKLKTAFPHGKYLRKYLRNVPLRVALKWLKARKVGKPANVSYDVLKASTHDKEPLEVVKLKGLISTSKDRMRRKPHDIVIAIRKPICDSKSIWTKCQKLHAKNDSTHEGSNLISLLSEDHREKNPSTPIKVMANSNHLTKIISNPTVKYVPNDNNDLASLNNQTILDLNKTAMGPVENENKNTTLKNQLTGNETKTMAINNIRYKQLLDTENNTLENASYILSNNNTENITMVNSSSTAQITPNQIINASFESSSMGNVNGTLKEVSLNEKGNLILEIQPAAVVNATNKNLSTNIIQPENVFQLSYNNRTSNLTENIQKKTDFILTLKTKNDINNPTAKSVVQDDPFGDEVDYLTNAIKEDANEKSSSAEKLTNRENVCRDEIKYTKCMMNEEVKKTMNESKETESEDDINSLFDESEIKASSPEVAKSSPEVAKSSPEVTKYSPEVAKSSLEVAKSPPEVASANESKSLSFNDEVDYLTNQILEGSKALLEKNPLHLKEDKKGENTTKTYVNNTFVQPNPTKSSFLNENKTIQNTSTGNKYPSNSKGNVVATNEVFKNMTGRALENNSSHNNKSLIKNSKTNEKKTNENAAYVSLRKNSNILNSIMKNNDLINNLKKVENASNKPKTKSSERKNETAAKSVIKNLKNSSFSEKLNNPIKIFMKIVDVGRNKTNNIKFNVNLTARNTSNTHKTSQNQSKINSADIQKVINEEKTQYLKTNQSLPIIKPTNNKNLNSTNETLIFIDPSSIEDKNNRTVVKVGFDYRTSIDKWSTKPKKAKQRKQSFRTPGRNVTIQIVDNEKYFKNCSLEKKCEINDAMKNENATVSKEDQDDDDEFFVTSKNSTKEENVTTESSPISIDDKNFGQIHDEKKFAPIFWSFKFEAPKSLFKNDSNLNTTTTKMESVPKVGGKVVTTPNGIIRVKLRNMSNEDTNDKNHQNESTPFETGREMKHTVLSQNTSEVTNSTPPALKVVINEVNSSKDSKVKNAEKSPSIKLSNDSYLPFTPLVADGNKIGHVSINLDKIRKQKQKQKRKHSDRNLLVSVFFTDENGTPTPETKSYNKTINLFKPKVKDPVVAVTYNKMNLNGTLFLNNKSMATNETIDHKEVAYGSLRRNLHAFSKRQIKGWRHIGITVPLNYYPPLRRSSTFNADPEKTNLVKNKSRNLPPGFLPGLMKESSTKRKNIFRKRNKH